MKSRMKIKNIIINFCLVIAMAMSILGGSILYASISAEGMLITNLPDDLTFYAQNTSYQVQGYNNNDGFIPTDAKFNYIENLSNIPYYVKSGQLYTDHSGRVLSRDVNYTAEATQVTAKKRLDADTENKIYPIHSDKYLIDYNGARLYLKKDNGKLYEDLECSKESASDYIYDSNTLYIYNKADAETINYDENLINRYVKFNGQKYYIDSNELYKQEDGVQDGIFQLIQDSNPFSPHFSGNIPAGDYNLFTDYTGGFNLYTNSISILYPYVYDLADATSYTVATIPAREIGNPSDIPDAKFVKINELNHNGTDYYVRIANANESQDTNLYEITAGTPNLARKTNSSLFKFVELLSYTADDKDTPETVDDEIYTYAIINYPYQSNNTATVQVEFKFTDISGTPTTYYVIQGKICNGKDTDNIVSKNAIGGNTYLQVTTTGDSDFTGDTSETYTIDTNDSRSITSNAGVIGTYYPIEIWNENYYIKSDDTTNLYTISISRSASGSIITAETIDNTIIGISGKTISKLNNNITIQIEFLGNYYLIDDTLCKLNKISLTGRDNFILFGSTYYYNDAKLYLTDIRNLTPPTTPEMVEVLDFEYTCDLTTVLYDNIYHNIESASYKYVSLNNIFYFLKGTTLYTDIQIGGDEEIVYLNPVNKEALAYKVNGDKITVFDESTASDPVYKLKNDGSPNDDYISQNGDSDPDIIGYVEDGGLIYLIHKNGNDDKTNDLLKYYYEITTPSSIDQIYFSYSQINFNYELIYDNASEELNEIKINGITSFTKTSADPDTKITTNASGDYAKITYNGVNYYTYNKNKATSNLLAITANINLYSPSSDLKVQGNVEYNPGNKTFTSTGLRDYVCIKNGNQYNYYFNDSIIDSSYTVYGDNEGSSSDDVVYNVTGSQLTNGGLEFSQRNFEYELIEDYVKITKKYNQNTKEFTTSENKIEEKEFNYIESTTNNKVYIVHSNNKLYEKIKINYRLTYSPQSLLPSATITADKVNVDSQPGVDYSILSNNGKLYMHATEDNFKSGDVAFLNNYALKNHFLSGGIADSTTKSESFYIAINKPYITDPSAEAPTINTGLTALSVYVYLKNDYISKFSDRTDSYYIDPTTGEVYGVRLLVNTTESENVKYAGDDTPSVNLYWYDYFDLTNIKAIIDYDGDSDYITEHISESSGLYTFVFDFAYKNASESNQATNYRYVYQIYLTENSDYIEFPTFNTNIDVTENFKYLPVVKLIDNGSDTRVYGYNNHTYDLPMYIFDATKYNVNYDFTFNLEAHSYTTDFSLANVGKYNEYGIYNIYKDWILDSVYKLYISTINNTDSSIGEVGKYNVVDYYKNEVYYGSLIITPSGTYKLSLEDIHYYNPENLDNRSYSKIQWLLNGRIIKNGATNTPQSYYMILILNDLGEYTFSHRYLISQGHKTNGNQTGEFKASNQKVKDSLYNTTYFATANNIGGGTVSLYGGELLKCGYYDEYTGEFRLLSSYETAPYNYSLPNPATSPDKNKLIYYGVKNTFNKNGTQSDFQKLDENIYSDVSGKINYNVDKLDLDRGFYASNSSKDSPNTIISIDDLINSYKGKLYFNIINHPTYGNDNFNIPLTNLQPIYFNYYGEFNYNNPAGTDNSVYYRYENCNYVVDEFGMLKSVDFKNSTRSRITISNNNKTSISDPGFYIVKMTYTRPNETNYDDISYFMFVIDNSAPVLRIRTHENLSDANGQPFISSNEITRTTRFTNADYITAKWNTPSYFQGEVKLGYQLFSYNTVKEKFIPTVQPVVYNNGSFIKTDDNGGEYVFTIWYGVNSLSYTSTYIVIDKTTPEGNLYDVDDSGIVSTTPSLNIFNSSAVFSSITKKPSKAKVYARLATISLEGYDNSSLYDDATKNIVGKLMFNNNKIEAIMTNEMINSNNELFNEQMLDFSPKYNLFNQDYLGSEAIETQVLGNSDQSLIYIIKLFDDAGNYSIYYYLFDISKPDIVYQKLPSGDANTNNILDNFENNITQTNSNIIWGNYKAIPISGNMNSELFKEFVESIKSNPSQYAGLTFKEYQEKTYLYVPIKSSSTTSSVDLSTGNSKDVTATTSSPNFSSRSTIFVNKNNDDRVIAYNTRLNYKVTIAGGEDFSAYENKFIDIFKGDKNYTFVVTDIVGNRISNTITLNSSVAQETFYLYNENNADNLGYANPNKKQVYNAESLKLSYIKLEDTQAFSAKITYDFYPFNFSHYLSDDGSAPSENINIYNEWGYDTVTGQVYRYYSDGKFHLCEYNNGKYTIIAGHEGLTFDELSDNIVFPGYPFALSNTNLKVNTIPYLKGSVINAQTYNAEDNKYDSYEVVKDETLNITNNPINPESNATKSGLYVFRRTYVNIDGTEITQDNIDNANRDEKYDILSDDYAIRYHIFYIDRNQIISLTYKNNGDLDKLNSIGDMLEFYLGHKLNEEGNNLILEKDAVINAEAISAYDNGNDAINVSKLKVETNFTADKYATTEKLQQYRNYSIKNDYGSDAFNATMEKVSIMTNSNIFKYNINLTDADNPSNPQCIVNNTVVSNKIETVDTDIDSDILPNSIKNYAIQSNGKYNFTIADISTFDKTRDIDGVSEESNIKSNLINYAFNVNRVRPQGQFISKADDAIGSIINLSQRGDIAIDSQGNHRTYKSSNVKNLSFTFSESNSNYDATINPYEVEVYKNSSLLFATKFSGNASEIDKFRNSTINVEGVKLTDILSVDTSNGSNRIYKINIFDEKSPVKLLSSWEDDAVYEIKVNFVGQEADYTISGDNGIENYFTTYHSIHIDRKAPEMNFINIANKDSNLDEYCLEKYGFTYDVLKLSDPANYQDLLNTYAFPIKMIQKSNLEYYFKKSKPNTSFPDENDPSYNNEVYNIYDEYGTLLYYNPDESIKIYYRVVDAGPTQYYHTILPGEEPKINHLPFSEASSHFQLLTTTNPTYGYYEIGNIVELNNTNPKFGYYELIEQDEAGNLTRYFTYISDNTNVEIDFNYITSEDDKFNVILQDEDNYNGTPAIVSQASMYIMYENERLYIIDNGGYKLYRKKPNSLKEVKIDGIGNKVEAFEIEEITTGVSINNNYYYSYNNKSFMSRPTSVEIEGKVYQINNLDNPNKNDLINGIRFVDSDFDNTNNPFGILNLIGLKIVKYLGDTLPAGLSSFAFDDFYTIKFHALDTKDVIKFVRNPYEESNEVFLTRVIREFQTSVDNNNNYSYKLEIINRFGDNYEIYFDLPDTDLSLTYLPSTKTPGNLTVIVPDFSEYNAKIKTLSIFYYEDHEWRPLIQDADGKIIQTSNITDENAGLPSATYELSAGQYRFYILDNFDRENTHYEIVGSNYNSEYNFQFEKSHIIDEKDTYITSGNAILMIDDNVWQVQVILKDAVTLRDSSSNDIITTLSLMSVGNQTFLVNQKGEQLYVNASDTMDIAKTLSPVFYSLGKIYYNNGADNIEITEIKYNNNGTDVECRLESKVVTSNNLIYTLGSNNAGRKTYILYPFAQVDEYVININWTTDNSNIRKYNIKIDRNMPIVHLTSESGSLEVMNNQSYYNPFVITWSSNYNIINARLVSVINGIRTEQNITNIGQAKIDQIGGYTLYLTDEIGNELSFIDSQTGRLVPGFSFEFVEEANEYFSVYAGKDSDNLRYLAPSNYISTAGDGKSIRHYYFYDDSDDGNFVTQIQTDETKYIKAYKITGGNTLSDPINPSATINITLPASGVDANYVIVRSNIDYIICYIKIVGVNPTVDISNFLNKITFNTSDKAPADVSTKYEANNNTYMLDQNYDSFELIVNTNLGYRNINYIGNKIIVNHYYNGDFVRSYMSDYYMTYTTTGPTTTYSHDTYSIKINTSGVHEFEFIDSLRNYKNITGNSAIINGSNRIRVTLIKDIMFTINELNPIDYQIFNSEVVLRAPETDYYNNIQVKATLNEKEISTDALRNNGNYTFTESGVYEVTMTAEGLTDGGYTQYISVYNFTIINPNVAKMTFGFSSKYGFILNKVIKNQADITDKFIKNSMDSIWLTSGEQDTVGNYTITLLGYDKIANDYKPFSFTVRLNNEIPSIRAVNYEFGTSTKKSITLQYNPALIYSQVGESYIQIINESGEVQAQIDINSDSVDNIESFIISTNGKFDVTIFNKDGNFIANYTVTKVAPLNTSAKIIIIVLSIVVIALAVVFVILRRHTKFR